MTAVSTTVDPTSVAATTFALLEQAWNDGDGAAFGSVFADDADFVDIRGAHHRGVAAIGSGHQAIFDSVYAGSTVRYEVGAAREVTPGSVVAVATSTLDAPVGPMRGINHSTMTAVIVEQDGRWAVTAFHNTLVAAS